jgi:hypothetical protein
LSRENVSLTQSRQGSGKSTKLKKSSTTLDLPDEDDDDDESDQSSRSDSANEAVSDDDGESESNSRTPRKLHMSDSEGSLFTSSTDSQQISPTSSPKISAPLRRRKKRSSNLPIIVTSESASAVPELPTPEPSARKPRRAKEPSLPSLLTPLDRRGKCLEEIVATGTLSFAVTMSIPMKILFVMVRSICVFQSDRTSSRCLWCMRFSLHQFKRRTAPSKRY